MEVSRQPTNLAVSSFIHRNSKLTVPGKKHGCWVSDVFLAIRAPHQTFRPVLLGRRRTSLRLVSPKYLHPWIAVQARGQRCIFDAGVNCLWRHFEGVWICAELSLNYPIVASLVSRLRSWSAVAMWTTATAWPTWPCFTTAARPERTESVRYRLMWIQSVGFDPVPPFCSICRKIIISSRKSLLLFSIF